VSNLDEPEGNPERGGTMTAQHQTSAVLNTAVVAVTVYPDSARVVRSGTMTLQPGLCRLEVAELPLSLDAASVRAAARGTARARLLGLEVRPVFYPETPAERVRELQNRIESLTDEIQTLDSQIELLQQERAALTDLANQTRIFARGLSSGRMTFESQVALLDGLRSRSENVNKALQETTARRREPQRQLEKLRHELDLLQGAQPSQRNAALLELEVLDAGDLTVELTYVVSDASWTPLYDVRLLEDNSTPKIELGYLAQVTQRTGEAWPDVSLVLSTARPALAGRLPELKPWYIGPLPPRQPMRGVGMPVAFRAARQADDGVATGEAEATPLAAAAVEADVEAEVVMAQVETRGTAVTYRVPTRVSIPDDGTPHKVTVTRYELRPRLDYVAAPKIVEAAHRRARVVNDSPYTLLPGSVNLFSDEDFIGATTLPLTPPQGELELFFGVEDRIKVERELKRQEADKPLLGGKRRRASGFEIKLENHLPFPAALTVQDQFPVSRHEEIKVRLESAEPRPTGQSELNLLEWELTLAPQEKRSLRFDFVVEYPVSMEIEGL
jgi:uncharacterized protein (TIGR02231 family)